MKKITAKNEWQLIVRKVWAQHPNWNLRQVLHEASKEYKKIKQKGGSLPKKPIGIAPIMRIPKMPKYALE